MKIMIRNALTGDATTIARFNALMAMETEGKALEQPLIGAGAWPQSSPTLARDVTGWPRLAIRSWGR